MLRTSAPLNGTLEYMKSAYLYGIFVATFAFAAGEAWMKGASRQAQDMYFWSQMIAITALIFAWVHTDAIEHKRVKSRWMNMGILALAGLFVPIYLYRARAPGQRIRAIRGYLLALLGYVLSVVAGSFLAYFLAIQ